MFKLGIDVSVLNLYNGRHSLWVGIHLGWRMIWIQRWDTERQPKGLYEPSGAMTWCMGVR